MVAFQGDSAVAMTAWGSSHQIRLGCMRSNRARYSQKDFWNEASPSNMQPITYRMTRESSPKSGVRQRELLTRRWKARHPKEGFVKIMTVICVILPVDMKNRAALLEYKGSDLELQSLDGEFEHEPVPLSCTDFAHVDKGQTARGEGDAVVIVVAGDPVSSGYLLHHCYSGLAPCGVSVLVELENV